jgi:DNA-binding response OmpR family regulator
MGKRLLLIHHSEPAVRSVVLALSQRGHQVSFCGALRGVADRVRSEAPDLVIIEIDRPDADGRDLARVIRRDARCNHVPIALWSMSDEDGRTSVVALGSQGFVGGGHGPAEIARSIEALLLRRQPHLPINEVSRLERLRSLRVLDTAPDPILDEIVAAASAMAGVPIALVSLVDAERQWFKSRLGLAATETPRNVAFCAHAIHGSEIFEINDALTDQRFAENPLVMSDPKIRFYAGAPLLTGDGLAMGTLCVIDRVPRVLSDSQRECLVRLGRAVTLLLASRRAPDTHGSRA